MKKLIYLILLVFFTYSIKSSTFKVNYQTISCFSCKEVFQSNQKKIRYNPYERLLPYHKKYNGNASLIDFLRCSVELANSGDSLALNFIRNYNKEIYKYLRPSENEVLNTRAIYQIARITIGELNNKESFNDAMNFLEQNICSNELYEEIGKKSEIHKYHTADENYAFGVFTSMILPKIHESQQKHYKRLFSNSLLNSGKKNPNDSCLKEWHKEFYPKIEQDWKEGKIRLNDDISE